MSLDPRCPNCNAALDPTAIDRDREIATCGNCGRLVDLRASSSQSHTGATVGAAHGDPTASRMRPAVRLPDGMTVSVKTGGSGLSIRRRWLRAKHWVMLAFFAGATAVVAHFWLAGEPNVWLYLGTALVVSWNYNLICMFLNQTTITASPEGVEVRHGPLPSPFGLGRSLRRQDVRQLYAARHGGLFSVRVQLASDDAHQVLVAPLVTAEQALFVERQLEGALGIIDVAVDGELGSEAVEAASGKPPKAARSGAALVLAIPILVGLPIGLFVLAASTEVTGTLNGSTGDDTWAMSPDDCHSGQREGFGGVVLTSEAAPNHQLRVVQDPVRGTLLVVATAGKGNLVVAPSSCSRFDVVARRTNTSINDIWVVEGRIDVDCKDVTGAVTFAGCH